jgi:hypothetical protein
MEVAYQNRSLRASSSKFGHQNLLGYPLSRISTMGHCLVPLENPLVMSMVEIRESRDPSRFCWPNFEEDALRLQFWYATSISHCILPMGTTFSAKAEICKGTPTKLKCLEMKAMRKISSTKNKKAEAFRFFGKFLSEKFSLKEKFLCFFENFSLRKGPILFKISE